MSADEFDSLKIDIGENKLREAIWTYDGQIIDGRNRYNACIAIGEEPRYRPYDGDREDLVAFVVSLNLKRRHLNESQRAMVAAKLANLDEGRPSKTPQICGVSSQAHAAGLLNVSERSVSSAKKVLTSGVPELVEAVNSGELPVSVGAVLARQSPKKQKLAIRRGRLSGKKLIVKNRVSALKKMLRQGVPGCLCHPDAEFTPGGIAAVMEVFAAKAAEYSRVHGTENFAGYFEGVSFDIAEGELSSLQMENAEKILAAIDAGTIGGELGLRERNDLQRLTKIPWAEFNDLIAKMISLSLVEVLEQQGKTDMARGARKAIYKRSAKKQAGKLVYTSENADPDSDIEDIYHDPYAENWA